MQFLKSIETSKKHCLGSQYIKMSIYILAFIIFVLSIGSIYTFGITGFFSIAFGHAFLVFQKEKLVNNKKLKYLVVFSLIFAYGYFASILILTLSWIFVESSH